MMPMSPLLDSYLRAASIPESSFSLCSCVSLRSPGGSAHGLKPNVMNVVPTDAGLVINVTRVIYLAWCHFSVFHA